MQREGQQETVRHKRHAALPRPSTRVATAEPSHTAPRLREGLGLAPHLEGTLRETGRTELTALFQKLEVNHYGLLFQMRTWPEPKTNEIFTSTRNLILD